MPLSSPQREKLSCLILDSGKIALGLGVFAPIFKYIDNPNSNPGNHFQPESFVVVSLAMAVFAACTFIGLHLISEGWGPQPSAVRSNSEAGGP